MELEEAAEILMVSNVTIRCSTCSGTGLVERQGPANPLFPTSDSEGTIFCPTCSGSCVLYNPIWAEAWLIAHPGDHAGMEARRKVVVAELWSRRKLY